MAEDKKSVIIYADWIKKFEALQDDEAGRLIKHFFRYVNDLNPIAPDRITELLFIDIQLCLKRDLKKWEKRAERSRENGKNGGRPTKPKKTQQVFKKPRKPDSVNGSVSVNVNDNNINNSTNVELPDKSGESFHSDFKRIYIEWFEKRNGVAPKMNFARDGKAINDIIAYLKNVSKDGRDPTESWKAILSRWDSLSTNYLKSNISLHQISNNLSNIINDIKNGTKSGNSESYNSVAQQILAELNNIE